MGLTEVMPMARTTATAVCLLLLPACDSNPSAPSPSVPDVTGRYSGRVMRAGFSVQQAATWPSLRVQVRQAGSQVEITGNLTNVVGIFQGPLPRITGQIDEAGVFTAQPPVGAAATVDLGFCVGDITTTSLTVRFSSNAAEWVEWADAGDCGDQRYSGTLGRLP